MVEESIDSSIHTRGYVLSRAKCGLVCALAFSLSVGEKLLVCALFYEGQLGSL